MNEMVTSALKSIFKDFLFMLGKVEEKFQLYCSFSLQVSQVFFVTFSIILILVIIKIHLLNLPPLQKRFLSWLLQKL
jgi:hypothetical protein